MILLKNDFVDRLAVLRPEIVHHCVPITISCQRLKIGVSIESVIYFQSKQSHLPAELKKDSTLPIKAATANADDRSLNPTIETYLETLVRNLQKCASSRCDEGIPPLIPTMSP